MLIPGLGATVNGARRWMRIGPMNFQVSELAKVLVLTWVCSYCVRKRERAHRRPSPASRSRWDCSAVAAMLLLIEPDFGAATVLFATGFAVLFVAGARLRYVDAGFRGSARLRGARPHLRLSLEAAGYVIVIYFVRLCLC